MGFTASPLRSSSSSSRDHLRVLHLRAGKLLWCSASSVSGPCASRRRPPARAPAESSTTRDAKPTVLNKQPSTAMQAAMQSSAATSSSAHRVQLHAGHRATGSALACSSSRRWSSSTLHQGGSGLVPGQRAALRSSSVWLRRAPQSRSVAAAALFDDERNNKDIGDRVIASLPYLLPLLDAIPFGKFIFLQFPFVARALAPLGPLASLYNGVPFAPLVIFLVVFNGIVNNQDLPRFVRFNAMQAVLLDVLLIIPQVLLGSLFRNPGNDPLSLQAYITVNNTIFLFVAVSVAYGMGASLVGQNARLPLVAEAADSQIRGPGGF